MASGIIHVTINIIIVILLIATILNIVPDIDHFGTKKKVPLKYKLVQLGKGFLGLEHDLVFHRGALHNFYIWFSIFIIGLLGMVHLFVDSLR